MDVTVILILAASTTSVYSSSASEPWLDARIPRSLYPIQYNLFLWLGVNENTFDGNVVILAEVKKTTNYILVHSHSNVSNVRVFNKTGEMNLNQSFEYFTNRYYVVETEEAMMKGTIVAVNMTFSSYIADVAGVYIAAYFDDTTGTKSQQILSNFKPNLAHLAFPCFDEPDFKSQFSITIRHWANYTAISNMPAKTVTNFDSNWIDTTFKRTPIISISNVGFVITNFDFRNSTLRNKKPNRIWAGSNHLNKVDYTLNVTTRIQDFLSRELGTLHLLEKIDQFDAPYTLYSDGQQQFGLTIHTGEPLTFSQTGGALSRAYHLIRVGSALASNYFGGIVSCREWNHVWLDVALSDFYAWKAAATIHSEEEVALEEHQRRASVLSIDSDTFSKVLVPAPSRPDDRNALFWLIYSPDRRVKGSALLRMLESFLGETNFKSAIKRYLRENSKKSVLTQDLWYAFQRYAGRGTNITEIMNPWLYNLNYPVITMQLLPDNKINITQKRFLRDTLADPNSPVSEYGYKWYVPINYITAGGHIGRIWSNKTTDVIDNPQHDYDEWIIFNDLESGHFRVNYDAAQWDNLTKQLISDHTVLSKWERSMLLNDALALANVGQLGFDKVLSLAMYAAEERYIPAWTNLYNGARDINKLLYNTSDFDPFQKYVLNLTTELMNELEVKDEGTAEQKKLREMIMELSALAGHQSCNENLTRIFQAWIGNWSLNPIPYGIEAQVLCSGIANSDNESDWNTAFRVFLSTPEYTVGRLHLNHALGCTRNPVLMNRFLEAFMSNGTDRIRLVELERGIKGLRTNPMFSRHIWSWIKQNSDEIDAKSVTDGSLAMAGVTTALFNTEAELQDVRNYLTRFPTTGACFRSGMKTYLVNNIKRNIRWMETNHETISRWLQENGFTE